MAIVEIGFAVAHPAAQGHFPGNPIIPGALLLAEALRAIGFAAGIDLTRWRIRAAKFVHPVRPGDRVTIDFRPTPDNEIRFSCAVAGNTVLTGQASSETTA